MSEKVFAGARFEMNGEDWKVVETYMLADRKVADCESEKGDRASMGFGAVLGYISLSASVAIPG